MSILDDSKCELVKAPKFIGVDLASKIDSDHSCMTVIGVGVLNPICRDLSEVASYIKDGFGAVYKEVVKLAKGIRGAFIGAYQQMHNSHKFMHGFILRWEESSKIMHMGRVVNNNNGELTIHCTDGVERKRKLTYLLTTMTIMGVKK